ncbi:hypothetical protein L6452_30366 [Arctium lappa]|uniref:Uncharacterized protein n=1 Tax=Arctium lappa TaxID=4217 RepID=A0ACB8ZJE6_ARCLA|nr:hypothetical protein L6452_30366 [Arctium lappa]
MVMINMAFLHGRYPTKASWAWLLAVSLLSMNSLWTMESTLIYNSCNVQNGEKRLLPFIKSGKNIHSLPGFDMDDTKLKRAGFYYWPTPCYRRHHTRFKLDILRNWFRV